MLAILAWIVFYKENMFPQLNSLTPKSPMPKRNMEPSVFLAKKFIDNMLVLKNTEEPKIPKTTLEFLPHLPHKFRVL